MKNIDLLKINGIDVDASLEILGDMEMYDETMEDFLSEIDEKLANIKKYKEENDMPNYAILTHSLKSDSKYLGFKTLADLSYQHELASKENNITFVNDNYDSLMAEANKIVTLVKEYLGE